jgi:lipopolysaccharide transport system permease protein
MFATPIIYPASMVPEKFQWIVAVNPLSGLIEAFRYAMVPDRTINWNFLLFSIAVTVVLLWVGVAYFKKAEKAFADIV